MTDGVRGMLMRGGTSKGLYFLADDLPDDERERDDFLLRVMGSPDSRQIDGIGGAHPLTSKVAVVSRSDGADTEIAYHFLQVVVDEPIVTDAQNCGNILAGVAPFAIERGLVSRPDGPVSVDILLVNTGGRVTASFEVAEGEPVYDGDTAISGVPGTAAPIRLDFAEVAGGSCGALLPTGRVTDEIAGVTVTLIDCGMPVVVMAAADVGISGYESCAELEAKPDLRTLLEKIRLEAGPMMNLGDVVDKTVPKLTMVAPPREGGALCTRTFIPHRCHDAIGVLGAVSVAAAALIDGTPAASIALVDEASGAVLVEHPTGSFEAAVEMTRDSAIPTVERAGIIRTARKLMDGYVYPRRP
jgi:4-oxalomesaconate tautomerase